MKFKKNSCKYSKIAGLVFVLVVIVSCAPRLVPAPTAMEEAEDKAGILADEKKVASDIDSMDELEQFDEELEGEISFENVDLLLE